MAAVAQDAAGLIAGKLEGDAWVRRLTLKARLLAQAHAEGRVRESRGDPSRWRRPQLLWPLTNAAFSRDDE